MRLDVLVRFLKINRVLSRVESGHRSGLIPATFSGLSEWWLEWFGKFPFPPF